MSDRLLEQRNECIPKHMAVREDLSRSGLTQCSHAVTQLDQSCDNPRMKPSCTILLTLFSELYLRSQFDR
jgi:hypothetical protein